MSVGACHNYPIVSLPVEGGPKVDTPYLASTKFGPPIRTSESLQYVTIPPGYDTRTSEEQVLVIRHTCPRVQIAVYWLETPVL